MVSQEAHALIDPMTREELLEEINRQNRSRFQGDNYAYLKTRLAVLDEEEKARHDEQLLKLAEDANRISGEANENSSGCLVHRSEGISHVRFISGSCTAVGAGGHNVAMLNQALTFSWCGRAGSIIPVSTAMLARRPATRYAERRMP